MKCPTKISQFTIYVHLTILRILCIFGSYLQLTTTIIIITYLYVDKSHHIRILVPTISLSVSKDFDIGVDLLSSFQQHNLWCLRPGSRYPFVLLLRHRKGYLLSGSLLFTHTSLFSTHIGGDVFPWLTF